MFKDSLSIKGDVKRILQGSENTVQNSSLSVDYKVIFIQEKENRQNF